MNESLNAIIAESGLQPEQAKPLLENFGDFFVAAHKLVTQAKAIKVTSEDQVDEMKKARELRLQLQDLRVEANKTRAALKEGYLRGGNAVQSIFNDIRDIIEPEETRLKEQEKFAELKAAERLEARNAKRIQELSKFVDDVSVYNLKDMEDEAFSKLLEGSKTAFEAQEAAKFKAEQERVAREKADREAAEQERAKREAEFKKAQEKAKIEREKARVANEKLDAERAAKIKAENELKAARELEEKKQLEEKQRVENQKRLEEEEKLKALLAPDREKLLKIAADLEKSLTMPAVTSLRAQEIVNKTYVMLEDTVLFIREEAKKL